MVHCMLKVSYGSVRVGRAKGGCTEIIGGDVRILHVVDQKELILAHSPSLLLLSSPR